MKTFIYDGETKSFTEKKTKSYANNSYGSDSPSTPIIPKDEDFLKLIHKYVSSDDNNVSPAKYRYDMIKTKSKDDLVKRWQELRVKINKETSSEKPMMEIERAIISRILDNKWK